MATARRSGSSSPTLRMWRTAPRGTQTMSSLPARTTTPPVSSHSRRPARTTHHSSNSRCQCGRLPPPGALAISVTRLRSSAIIRLDQGGGPICVVTSAIRVCRTLGQVELAAEGGVGPEARRSITMVAGDGEAVVVTGGSPSAATLPLQRLDSLRALELHVFVERGDTALCAHAHHLPVRLSGAAAQVSRARNEVRALVKTSGCSRFERWAADLMTSSCEPAILA